MGVEGVVVLEGVYEDMVVVTLRVELAGLVDLVLYGVITLSTTGLGSGLYKEGDGLSGCLDVSRHFLCQSPILTNTVASFGLCRQSIKL